MKVLDLLCARDHGFEGWFASEDDFQAQRARELVQCPLCASAEIRKALSAPRLHLRGSGDAAARSDIEVRPAAQADAAATDGAARAAAARSLQADWLKLARHVVAHTEDVGTRFAEEARRMHEGAAPERAIRGQASPQQAAQLLDDGIAVLPLLLPAAADEPLH